MKWEGFGVVLEGWRRGEGEVGRVWRGVGGGVRLEGFGVVLGRRRGEVGRVWSGVGRGGGGGGMGEVGRVWRGVGREG